MSPTTTASQQTTLRDYLQVLRRRKWVILLAVVLVPMIALAYSLHQRAQYQASAQVLLSEQDLGAQLSGVQTSAVDPTRLGQTQASLARVPAVAQGAIDATRVSMSPGAFLGASSVTPGTNSDLLTFAFSNHDPRLAQLLATAYARSYVRYRLAADTAPIKAALREVEAQIAQLQAHGSLYASLQEKATQLRTLAALKTANASVVQVASAAAQTAPRTNRNVLLGLVLGLGLGIALAFLREALDTRVRTAEAIHERLGLPLLGRLPEPSKKLKAESGLAMLAEPSGVQAEAFRMLRTNLEFTLLATEARVVMVTSAAEQEGKSTTIANLAVACARGGQHVVLVDLDLRRPFLDRFFGLGDQPGFTQVAIGRALLDEALAEVPLGDGVAASANGNGAPPAPRAGRLEVLASGPIPPDPGEFVGTARLTEILETLRSRADLVLIDAPPVFHVGDGLALSAKVDAVFIVTRMQVMRRPMLTELHRLLETMPAHKLGFVVTGAEAEDAYGYGYGGYYYYRPYSRRHDSPPVHSE